MLNIKKLCNAFVPDAEMVEDIPTLNKTIVDAATGAVDRYKKKHGGLWVGGTVLITDEGVAFAPNGMNIAIHRYLCPIMIPRQNIESVRREFGWLTGIVIVTHKQGDFRFRCFGAKSVAERICTSLRLKAHT
jgi:hypothetical protein